MTDDLVSPLDGAPLGGDLPSGGSVGGDVRPTASYTLRVNGFDRPVTDAWIGESLLYVLRERLGLAGAKDGCEQGECGACSVQVDGQLVAGCLVPAALAADSEIATVEGLSGGGTASDVQQALADSGAVQCGYCTPGLAMAVHDLLQRNHRPSEVEARQALCGNLCRCTGYRGVLAAVQTVAEAREAELEADLAAAEAAAAEAALTGAAPGGEPSAGPAGGVRAVATEQSASDLPLAGELPLYADDELWHEADQLIPTAPTAGAIGGVLPDDVLAGTTGLPAVGLSGGPGDLAAEPRPTLGGYPGTHPGGFAGAVPGGDPAGDAATTHQTGVYEPAGQGGAYDAPAGQGGAYDAPAGQGGVYEPAGHQGGEPYPTYVPTPAHGTPYDPSLYETGSYPTVPGQAAGYDTGTFEAGTFDTGSFETGTFETGSFDTGTFHTGSFPAAGYDTGSYPQTYEPTGYETATGTYEATPAHGTVQDGHTHEGTPAHGTPYIPTPPHGISYDYPAGYDGTTPAHGIRLPEDRNA